MQGIYAQLTGAVHLPLVYVHYSIYVTGPQGGGTGTLDELAGSLTRLVIYPALTICN